LAIKQHRLSLGGIINMKTISLKLAKEINALAEEKGVVSPESQRHYEGLKGTGTFIPTVGAPDERDRERYEVMERFSTDELLGMLPNLIDKYELKLKKGATGFWAYFEKEELKSFFEEARYAQYAETPAEALGLLYKKLILEGIICE